MTDEPIDLRAHNRQAQRIQASTRGDTVRLTNGSVMDVLAQYVDDIARHRDHLLRQVGRCVYCDDCNERLYQGTLPRKGVTDE